MTKETIKSELISLLNKADIDYSEVLRLSNELSKLDENHVRFSIDAAHISRLGKELVSRQETAVAELVKNAYDADSTSVELIYENTDSISGTLTITDKGNGMSRKELINGFMRISTSDKRHNPKSEKYGRTRAGQKGIGRFAAQRLGNKLTIITQREEDTSALEVTIDWKNFESDSDLLLISNKVNVVSKTSDHGTKLIIHDLCDAWSEAQIRRVYRYIIELIQPVPLSNNAASSQFDPGFRVICKKTLADKEPLIIADDQSMVFDHALAEIRGYVDDKGIPHWTVKSKQLKLNDSSNHNDKEFGNKYIDLKGVNFHAYYFIYSNEYIPRQLKTKLTKLGNEKGGIRIYRNGFRVRPYGEAYNDWLRLDYSASLRQILPPHSNQNFFGFVELHDPDGQRFEETASREGLIENHAYQNLVDFVSSSLKAAVLRVAAAREKKQRPSQPGWVRPSASDQAEADPLREAGDNLRKLNQTLQHRDAEKTASSHGSAPSSPSSSSNEMNEYELPELSPVSKALGALEKAEQERAAMIEEIGMLRVLASLGLSIGEFTHEIKHYFPAIRLDIKSLNSSKDDATIKARLDKNLATIQSYSSYFDATVSANVSRERKPLELRDVVNDFIHATTPIADRAAISVSANIQGYDLFTKPMHYSEWASILNNLFTNAKKSIKKANSKGKILIEVGTTDDFIILQFSDNGTGIDSDIQERIFDAFFTTSESSDGFSDENDAIGTGLGLKLVTDILVSSGGSIALTQPTEGYSTTFRIEIPAADPSEIQEDDY